MTMWLRRITFWGIILTMVSIRSGFCQVSESTNMAQGTGETDLPTTISNETKSENAIPDIDALIDLLLQKGILSADEAEELKTKAGIQRVPALGEESVIYIVPDVPDSAKQEIIKELENIGSQSIEQLDKKAAIRSGDIMQRQRLAERDLEKLEREISEINTKLYKSDWSQRIKLKGDIRLRAEGLRYDDENVLLFDPNEVNDNGSLELMNTREDRDRYRYRVRLAANAKIVDPRSSEINIGKMDVGLRLVSGSDNTPISTNNTMGNYWLSRDLVFDRAYLRYTYTSEELRGGALPRLMLMGGRVPNPFFSTDLVWDSDLNFEGLVAQLYTDTQDHTMLKGFLTAGVFPLEEDAFTNEYDKYLNGVQIGVEFKPRYDLSLKFGAAYYDYINIEGKTGDPQSRDENDNSAPLFFQKGNTLYNIDAPEGGTLLGLASDYNLMNFTGMLDLGMFHPVHVMLIGDYVENVGFDEDDVEDRVGEDVEKEIIGRQLGLKVGYPTIRDYLEWDVSLFRKYLEADAVLDAFTDSDFHDGGTNAEGWILSFGLGLYHDVWLRVRYLTTDEIEGRQLEIDTLQFSISARF